MSAPGPEMVHLSGVTKQFGAVTAVSDAELCVERGEFLALLGPSGCGKTTLLRLIAGFERPDAGSVTVGETQVAGPGCFVAPERRRIGMVFQDYALFPHLTVEDNVAFGLGRRPREERDALTRRTLELVGLQHKARSYPHELSGGERQRVALARALAPEPEVVLLDEPFSSLDASLRADLRREVRDVLDEAGATAVFVTHDQEEALSIADELVVMAEGRVLQAGTPHQVYRAPATREVAALVGESNFLAGEVRNGVAHTPIGRLSAPGLIDGPIELMFRPESVRLDRDP